MKAWGVLLMVLGGAAMAIGFALTGAPLGATTLNLGLLVEKLQISINGMALFVAGSVFAAIGSLAEAKDLQSASREAEATNLSPSPGPKVIHVAGIERSPRREVLSNMALGDPIEIVRTLGHTTVQYSGHVVGDIPEEAKRHLPVNFTSLPGYVRQIVTTGTPILIIELRS